MKELLKQALRDTDRNAAAELRQMLEAEMQRPTEERDYNRIRALSEACCEMMGAKPSAERGIQAVRARLQNGSVEAESETYVVDVKSPVPRFRILTTAAACIVLALGFIGGSTLLRNQTADQIPAPQPDHTDTTPVSTEQTTVYTIATSPVTLPVVVQTEIVPEAGGEDAIPVTEMREETHAETAPAISPDRPDPVRTDPPAQTTETTLTVTEPPTEMPSPSEAPDTSPDAYPGFSDDQWEADGTPYASIVPQESEETARHLKLLYALGWVPDGYQLIDTVDDTETRTLTYSDGSHTLTLLQRTHYAPPLEPFETGYCPADYTVTAVRVSRYSGWLAQRTDGEECVLTWDVGDYLFTLTGNDPEVLRTAALALYITTE